MAPTARNVHRLRGIVQTLVENEDRRLRGLRAKNPCRSRFEYEQLREFQSMLDPGRMRLDAFERALRFLFEECNVKLGYLQHRFMKAVRKVLITRMFGEHLVANFEYLKERYGFTTIEETVCILFPRRSGKTTVQTIAAACIAVSQPDGNVVSFHLTGRQSSAWLTQCMLYLDLFKKSPEFAWEEVNRHMPERIAIRSAAAGTVNTISSYPGAQAGSFENLRGMGFKLAACFIDEAAFFDEKGMPVLLPLVANGAALILTSSIAAGGKAVGALKVLEAKDTNGKSIVLEVNMMSSCPACKQRGEEDRCTHIVQRPQHFQRRSDQARLKSLMAPYGDNAYEREMQNRQDKLPTEPAFPMHAVAELENKERDIDVSQRDHAFVYVAVDPHGGGSSNATLITVLYMRTGPTNRSVVVVLSADNVNTGITNDLGAKIARHFVEVARRISSVRNAMFVLNVEANMAYAPESVENYLNIAQEKLVGMPRVFCIRSDRRRSRVQMGGGGGAMDIDPVYTAGSRTSAPAKLEMIETMIGLLKADAVYFAKQFFVTQPEYNVTDGKEIDTRREIIRELANFKRETIYPKKVAGRNTMTRPRFTFSGKYGTNSDDWVMAFVIASFTIELFRRDKRNTSMLIAAAARDENSFFRRV